MTQFSGGFRLKFSHHSLPFETNDHPPVRRGNAIKRRKCVSDGADTSVVPINDLLNA